MPDDLFELSRLLAEPGQPETLFRSFDAVAARLVGHELFTLLYVDGQEVARIYSNRPAQYPVFGRKPMGPTPWITDRSSSTLLPTTRPSLSATTQ